MAPNSQSNRDQYVIRRDKLLRTIKKNDIHAILVTDETNVSYLTGFTGDSSWFLFGPGICCMLSDTRYQTQLAEQCPEIDTQIRDASGNLLQLLQSTIAKGKYTRIGLETARLSKLEFDQIVSAIEKCECVATNDWVEDLRAIKDKSEIEEIKLAIKMAQNAFNVIRYQLNPNQTEAEVANNLEHQIRSYGGDGCAFEPIVGVGARAALPHAEKSDKKIGESPFVLIDWGAKASRYLCDLTRILVTGKISPKLQRIYGVVLNAQLSAIEKIKPGASFHEVDKTAREVIADAGFGKNFGHGLGHGFGLQIHESPRLRPDAPGEFKAGMVVTVEPGIYIPGWGGVRIEDDILVTKDGHVVLSDLPKDFETCVTDCDYY